MWTKFLNALGFETKAQKEEFEKAKLEFLREARREQAIRRMMEYTPKNVITTDDVPGKPVKPMPKKTNSQVKAEHYGIARDEDYLTPGFNSYYEPTTFIPAIVLPTLEPYVSPESPVSDSGSDSSCYDSGSSNDSYSSSYDSSCSDSSSSYDSGSW